MVGLLCICLRFNSLFVLNSFTCSLNQCYMLIWNKKICVWLSFQKALKRLTNNKLVSLLSFVAFQSWLSFAVVSSTDDLFVLCLLIYYFKFKSFLGEWVVQKLINQGLILVVPVIYVKEDFDLRFFLLWVLRWTGFCVKTINLSWSQF